MVKGIPIRRMDGKADLHGDRSELVEAIVGRYRSGSRGDKRLIVAVTGYHRKHAIRVLRHRASMTPGNNEAQPSLSWRCSRSARGVVGVIGPPVFQTAAAVDTYLVASA